MLITLQEDGVLRVYESVAAAVLDVEGLDAEETFRAIFDDSGQEYRIQWIRPNERSRWVAASGEYTLVPVEPVNIPALLRLLRERTFVEPEGAEDRLREIERRLSGSDVT